jgi:hypothetical protein
MAVGLVECAEKNAMSITLPVLHALLLSWNAMDMDPSPSGWTEGYCKENTLLK